MWNKFVQLILFYIGHGHRLQTFIGVDHGRQLTNFLVADITIGRHHVKYGGSKNQMRCDDGLLSFFGLVGAQNCVSIFSDEDV